MHVPIHIFVSWSRVEGLGLGVEVCGFEGSGLPGGRPATRPSAAPKRSRWCGCTVELLCNGQRTRRSAWSGPGSLGFWVKGSGFRVWVEFRAYLEEGEPSRDDCPEIGDLHPVLSRRVVVGTCFRVQGSGFRVQGSGFRVQGSGFRVQGSGCWVSGVPTNICPSGHVVMVGSIGRWSSMASFNVWSEGSILTTPPAGTQISPSAALA